MAVTMADITKLRKMTGAGMMDCKNALTEAEANGKCGSTEAVSDSVDLTVSDIKLNIVGTFGKDYAKNQDNNDSLVVSLEHLGNSFLFAGDIEKQRIADMLSQGRVQPCDFLKVPHHGSTTSSSLGFLEAVSPEYAIISVGKGNSYGHPDYDTIQKLKQVNAEIYRTDELGTINIVFSANDIKITY